MSSIPFRSRYDLVDTLGIGVVVADDDRVAHGLLDRCRCRARRRRSARPGSRACPAPPRPSLRRSRRRRGAPRSATSSSARTRRRGSADAPGSGAAADRVVERVEPALVAEPLAIEQPAHEHDRLVEPVETLAEAGAEVDAVTRRARARTRRHRSREPPDRPRRGRGSSRAWRSARVPERVRPDHQAEPDLRRQRPERVEHGPAFEDRLLPRAEDGHQVVPRPDRIPAGLLGREGRVAETRPIGLLRPELEPELRVMVRWSWMLVARNRKLIRSWRCEAGEWRSVRASVRFVGVIAAAHPRDVGLGRRVIGDHRDRRRSSRPSDSHRCRRSPTVTSAGRAAGWLGQRRPTALLMTISSPSSRVPDDGLARHPVGVDRSRSSRNAVSARKARM